MKKAIVLVLFQSIMFSSFAQNLKTIEDNFIRYGKWEQAIIELQELLPQHIEMTKTHAHLGLCFYEIGEFSKSAEHYLLAIDHETNDRKKSNYYFNVALGYYQLLKTAVALDMLDKSIHYNITFFKAYYIRGLIYYQEDKIPEALSDWKKYINYSTDTMKKAKVSKVVTKIEQEALRIQLRKEEDARRKQELLDLLSSDIDTKKDKSKNFQEYKIQQDFDDEENFELID